MKRPIVTDPTKFDGAPFIEGTEITIAEVQAFWRQPGIGAVEIRKRFLDLSEAELGAAVTYAEPVKPEFEFTAEADGPPRRRLYIWSQPPGWMFAWDEVAVDGSTGPGGDYWDETWERILLYPETYAAKNVVWRDERSGDVVDIYEIELKP